ncbi:dual specificity protein phosphatase 22-B isoform X2 [Pagrus major]
MTYLCISAADLPTQNLTQHFKQSIMFMHESRLKGEGCLVHCLAGVSRSVTLVVAYIMTVTGLGWQEALAAVKVARPCAGPNLGFQRQLQEFEATQADQLSLGWSNKIPYSQSKMCTCLPSLPAVSPRHTPGQSCCKSPPYCTCRFQTGIQRLCSVPVWFLVVSSQSSEVTIQQD